MEHWEQWDFEGAHFPVALRCASLMVNLPTDVEDITPVLRFIDHIDPWIE